MPTHADVPIAHVRDPGGLAAPVAGLVADELQAIFPDAPPRPNGARAALGVSRDGRRSRQSQNRIAALGAMAAAALAGLSAGALIGRHPAPDVPSPQRTERLPIVLASQARPQQAAVKATPVSAQQPASSKGLPGPGPLAPPQLVWTANEAPSTIAVVKAKPERATRPRDQRVSRQRGSYSSSRSDAPASIQASTSRCRADCDYEDVLTADARLRRAYASAADAGVSRPVLVSYRNEWSGLRKRAPTSPDRVVSRYYEMAQDLERYADRPKAGRSSSPRSHALAGLRADLASLFP